MDKTNIYPIVYCLQVICLCSKDILHSYSSSMKLLDLHMTVRISKNIILTNDAAGRFSITVSVWEVPSAVWLDLHALGSWCLISTFSIIFPGPNTISVLCNAGESLPKAIILRKHTDANPNNDKNNYFWKVSLAQLQISLISVKKYIGQ